MNYVFLWLQQHGISGVTQGTLIEFAVACGLVGIALVIGVLSERTLGKIAQDAWHRHLGHQAEGLGGRIARIVRHGTAAILLAIAAAAYPWSEIATVPIGLVGALATAIVVTQILRGVGLGRWLAWLVAAMVFVALFSHAVGGLAPITSTLERIGFDVGTHRFSLLSLIIITVTVVALIAMVRLANRVIGHWIIANKSMDATQKLLAQKLAGVAILVAAFFFGIDLLNIDLTVFAVFSGALGLAVGFGLQKTVGNLIAGIILLMDRSIKPGDVIVVGQKDVGWVNKIGVRAVSVITRDGKEHLIPNENLMTQEVENWSYTDRNVRVRVPIGVSYSCDLKLAQSLMLQAAADSPRVLDSPKPNVWLTAFGDSAVEHELLVWISDPEGGVGNVRSDLLNRLWVMFKDNDIEIPFPQRDLNLKLSPAAAATDEPTPTPAGKAP